MKWLAVMLLALLCLIAGGCARHVVVERGIGRVDGARGVSTSSDANWSVQHEPAAAADGPP